MHLKKVHIRYCQALLFLSVLLLFSNTGVGTPITTPLSQYIEIQEKVCTASYADDQISYRKVLAKIFGLPGSGMFATLKLPKEYSGFKLIKKHYIKNGFTGISSHISFNYCEQGKLVWSRDFPISHTQPYDFDWNNPICVYNCSSLQEKVVLSMLDHNSTSAIKIKKQNKTEQAETILAQTKKSIKEQLKIHSLNKQKFPSLKSKALRDPTNFVCFKYARRKKYANSDLNVFFPQQWVGGLFYCDLNVEQKKDLLVSNMDENLNPVNQTLAYNTCNFANAIPILPVVADQYKNYWTDYVGFKKTNNRNKKEPHFEMVKNVPYLYTPQITGILDLKTKTTLRSNESLDNKQEIPEQFSLPLFSPNWKFRALDFFRKTSFMSQAEKWFNKISVTEKYDYNQSEMNSLERLAQLTLTKLQQMAKAENFDGSTLWSMEKDHLPKSKMLKLHKFAISKYLSMENFLVDLIGSKLFSEDAEELQVAVEKLQIEDQKTFDYCNP